MRQHFVSREMRRYNHLMGEIEAVYHDISWKMELSDSAMQILYTIYYNGAGCLLQDICRQTGLSKQTVNSALRKLEADQVVYLEQAGSRNKRVCLTEGGQELADRTVGRLIQIENEIFASWKSEDVQRYLDLTESYLMALREKLGEFN